jgi:hypothetical protein
VAARKPFLLRIDREVLDAVQRWADDDLRSLNGQIEFLLRRVLKDSGRLKSDRKSEIGDPKSEIGDRKSEIDGRKSTDD